MSILPIDSCRYGSEEMKEIFKEDMKLQYQLNFEAEVAIAQAKLNIIPPAAAKEISVLARSKMITSKRVKQLERISEHDTAAVVEAICERCSSVTKPWVHFGLTSNDVIDSCTSMQIRDAFAILEPKLSKLSLAMLYKAKEFRRVPAVGRTHGQHASIISFGLKFAVWASELAQHLDRIEEGKKRFLMCKTLGVVGTGSLMGTKAIEVQEKVAERLGLNPIEAATQVIPRERFAESQFVVSLIGCTLDKIAVEIRNLQRTEIGEVEEPFRKGQMGSSAVPVKRNPIKSERVSSLARILRSLLAVAMENIPLWHERDLTNSANERFTFPMSFILVDEMLNAMLRIFEGLKVNPQRIKDNINKTKGQIYSEFLLEALVKKGIPRFSAYRDIQRIAFDALENGEDFQDIVMKDPSIMKNLTIAELKKIFNPSNHLSASEKIITNVSNGVKKTISKLGSGSKIK
jgi:adenylosuccinate lyase